VFEGAGCKMMGATSTDGYDHTSSKAERDGKFCGLLCDEDNQYDMSEDRAVSTALMCCDYVTSAVLSLSSFTIYEYPCLQKAWIEQLKGEGFF
jgi:hypothetical protein